MFDLSYICKERWESVSQSSIPVGSLKNFLSKERSCLTYKKMAEQIVFIVACMDFCCGKPNVTNTLSCVLASLLQADTSLLNQIAVHARIRHNRSLITVLKSQNHFSIGN